MGNGYFDDRQYIADRVQRAANNVPDFAYTQTAKKVHETLDPMRIRKKLHGVLESCDSVEHPISTPIIVTFDVTGSNYSNACVVHQDLPSLMAKLSAVCENPQLAIWSNDDVIAVGPNAIQMSEFESNNLIDNSIRHLWLTSDGGSNGRESYDLLVYAAARLTSIDSMKRGKKGVMCLYADEEFYHQVERQAVKEIFGDEIPRAIPIGDMFAEAMRKWNIYMMWPRSGYASARRQYQELVGDSRVITVERPNQLCDQIAEIVGRHVQDVGEAVEDEFTVRQV